MMKLLKFFLMGVGVAMFFTCRLKPAMGGCFK